MLIPRFSIGKLLLITAGCSLFGPVLAAAFRGQFWSLGIVIGLATIPVFLLVHAILFALVALIGGRGYRQQRETSWRNGDF